MIIGLFQRRNRSARVPFRDTDPRHRSDNSKLARDFAIDALRHDHCCLTALVGHERHYFYRFPPRIETGASPRAIARATLSGIFPGRPTEAAMVEALALAINRETLEHACRVQRNALALAAALNLTHLVPAARPSRRRGFCTTSANWRFPSSCSTSRVRWTPDEFDQVKRHARSRRGDAGVRQLARPARRHRRASSRELGRQRLSRSAARPPRFRSARVSLAIVDCYDALTSDRPYRGALSRQVAVALIQRAPRQRRTTRRSSRRSWPASSRAWCARWIPDRLAEGARGMSAATSRFSHSLPPQARGYVAAVIGCGAAAAGRRRGAVPVRPARASSLCCSRSRRDLGGQD